MSDIVFLRLVLIRISMAIIALLVWAGVALAQTRVAVIVVDFPTSVSPHPQTLEIQRGYDRDVGPFVNDDNVHSGVVIHYQDWQGQDAYLMPMNPDDASGDAAPALTVGQAWCLPGNRVELTVLTVSAAGALVRIDQGHCR